MGELTLITFLPVVGAAVIAFLPRKNPNLVRWTALITTAIVLVIAISLFPRFDRGMIGINDINSFQFIEKASWIPAFHINYLIGVDGLSLSLIHI